MNIAAGTPSPPARETPEKPGRMVAVIDLGTSSMRMAIAHIAQDGTVSMVDSLSQSVGIGRDSFEDRMISSATTRECISILKSFKRHMAEYGISDPAHYRAVATSAVREALNRQAFLDRLYMATGIAVEAIDEAETSRLVYFGILPWMDEWTREDKDVPGAHTLVVEIGGGSTELLLLRQRDVVLSRVVRFGCLRLRQSIESLGGGPGALRRLIHTHLERALEEVLPFIPDGAPLRLVMVGGDMRFAARQTNVSLKGDGMAPLRVEGLEALAEAIAGLAVEDVVKRYQLPFSEAESLGTALVANATLARLLKAKSVLVSGVSMRAGMIKEMAGDGGWNLELEKQIERSAMELGHRYHMDEDHARSVSAAATRLFELLQAEHELPPRYQLVLRIAALLHECGRYVHVRSHHKHSMYLILNSEIFGLSRRMVEMIALTARYHRRSSPKPTHALYPTLPRDERIAVSKLSALLRVADALCRVRNKKARFVRVQREAQRIVLFIDGVQDLTLERMALREKSSMFEEVFGMKIEFKKQGQHDESRRSGV